MKYLVSLSLLMVSFACLTSCSGDEPSSAIDLDYISSLTRGEISTSYKLIDVALYDKSDATGNKYVPVDLMNYFGWSAPGADLITIHNGNTCTPVKLFDLARGPHPLGFPVACYRKKTGFDGEFYVNRPVEYDETNNKMKLGYYEYDIQEASEKRLVLVHYSDYLGGQSGNGGIHKSVLVYQVKQVGLSELEKSYFFDSNFDAYMGIIDLIRDEMGSVFDINPYFVGILEAPEEHSKVDLDYIEAEIRKNPDFWGYFCASN